jgi:hypothetical protein
MNSARRAIAGARPYHRAGETKRPSGHLRLPDVRRLEAPAQLVHRLAFELSHGPDEIVVRKVQSDMRFQIVRLL